MRKIVLINSLDPESFMPIVTLKQKLDDGSIETIFSETLKPVYSKYTKVQQEKIDQCNRILVSKNMPEMSEGEIDFMLDPSGFGERLNKLEKEMQDPENLQRLAGFRVERKVIPLD